MNRKLFMPVLLAAILITAGCNDFFEKNISKQSVSILAPANGTTLSGGTVTFWWDSVPSATKYEIQVVAPSFANIQYLEIDSYVIGNKLFYTLPPGSYQWKIRAINSSSSTGFFTSSFSIDSSLNLGNQQVQLISPANNYVTNKLTVNFSWASAYYATDYRFEILNSSGISVFLNAAYQKDTISYTFTNGDTYSWRVRAQNGSSVSEYSTYRLVVDTAAPQSPTGISPANGSTVTNPFTLSWIQTADNGSAIYDSLYIFKDVTQDTLITALRPITASFTDSLALGNYYWKLRPIDSAGNYGNYTSLYGFIIH